MADSPRIVADRDTSLLGLSQGGAVPPARLGGRLRRLVPGDLRRVVESYCQVLAGTVGRLGLQAVYFFVLANTLSLHDMGVFASTSAAGVMIGCFSGFGFSSYAFRASAGRRRLLGPYMAVFYACWLASVPLGLLVSLPFYYGIFRDSIALPAFLMILVVEIAFWRLIELIHQINNGLGRYTAASLVITIAAATRALAAVVFALAGGGPDETWAVYYLVANGAAMAVVWTLYRPRVRLRWRTALFVGRLKRALLFAVSYFAFNAQSEIDKVIMLSLADERVAGIYAISMRLIDFTTVPFRTFYVLYSRKLIREGEPVDILARGLRLEAVIAVLSSLGYAALIALLWLKPGLLGPNVTVAMTLFGVLFAVPAFKNLLEFHAELFFAYERMTARAVVSTSLVVLKGAGLALLLLANGALEAWAPWLNALYGALYLVSVVAVYRAVAPR